MHGRLRVKTTEQQRQEQEAREREKAHHFQSLSARLFDLRPSIKLAEDFTEHFKLSSEILLINPDFYTAWNIRKELLLLHVERSQPNEAQVIWKNELAFTIDCLKINEKSYSVWQHRVWILSQMPGSVYSAELQLCNSFLAKDERNFHCWDYRSYISELAKTDLESEIIFTTEKIKSNFSNFSAWHRRHKLFLKGLELPEDQCPKSCNLRLVWNQEYDMILNAIYTDPADQSPWLYHNWLVKNNFGNFNSDCLEKLKTLLDMEQDNRWIKQAYQLSLETFTNQAKT